jgi:hypothetical protein
VYPLAGRVPPAKVVGTRRVPSTPDRRMGINPIVADSPVVTAYDRGRNLARRVALMPALRLLGLIAAAVLLLGPVSAPAQVYWHK